MFVNIILKLDTLNIYMYKKKFFIVICRLFKMLIRYRLQTIFVRDSKVLIIPKYFDSHISQTTIVIFKIKCTIQCTIV